MATTNTILAKVASQFPLPAVTFRQASPLFLTLYLSGSQVEIEGACIALREVGWVNTLTSEDFSGFMYPKKAVQNQENEVLAMLREALAICNSTGVELLEINIDTDIDPSRSTFMPLYSTR